MFSYHTDEANLKISPHDDALASIAIIPCINQRHTFTPTIMTRFYIEMSVIHCTVAGIYRHQSSIFFTCVALSQLRTVY